MNTQTDRQTDRHTDKPKAIWPSNFFKVGGINRGNLAVAPGNGISRPSLSSVHVLLL